MEKWKENISDREVSSHPSDGSDTPEVPHAKFFLMLFGTLKLPKSIEAIHAIHKSRGIFVLHSDYHPIHAHFGQNIFFPAQQLK